MTTKTRSKKAPTSKGRSPEQKRAEMEALHAKLAEGVEALRNSETWAAYLAFCASFHRYSFNNLMLIWLQCPEAQHVAGYRAWQAKGRQVRKGERGIRIFGTGTVKVTKDDEEDESGEVVAGKRRIFFPVSVFDIAQTDLMDGHEDTSTIVHQLTGEDENDILGRVVDYLTRSGVTVEFREISNSANGYTTPADEKIGQPVNVVIEARNSPAQQAKTAIHEAAHIVLGHLSDYEEYVAHKGRAEVEAESVAYVVAGMLGLDSSDYSTGYVAGWATQAETDVLKDTAAQVLKAVHTLTEALDLDGCAEADDQAA